jgi:hypothetical protein
MINELYDYALLTLKKQKEFNEKRKKNPSLIEINDRLYIFYILNDDNIIKTIVTLKTLPRADMVIIFYNLYDKNIRDKLTSMIDKMDFIFRFLLCEADLNITEICSDLAFIRSFQKDASIYLFYNFIPNALAGVIFSNTYFENRVSIFDSNKSEIIMPIIKTEIINKLQTRLLEFISMNNILVKNKPIYKSDCINFLEKYDDDFGEHSSKNYSHLNFSYIYCLVKLGYIIDEKDKRDHIISITESGMNISSILSMYYLCNPIFEKMMMEDDLK